MKPTLLHMYLYTSTVLSSLPPICTTASVSKYFKLKRLVDQIGRAHSAMEVLQSSLILP